MTTIRQLIANGTITLDTKVLGTLLLTGDGAVIGHRAVTYWTNKNTHQNIWETRNKTNDWKKPVDSYSTREAAESARKEPHV